MSIEKSLAQIINICRNINRLDAYFLKSTDFFEFVGADIITFIDYISINRGAERVDSFIHSFFPEKFWYTPVLDYSDIPSSLSLLKMYSAEYREKFSEDILPAVEALFTDVVAYYTSTEGDRLDTDMLKARKYLNNIRICINDSVETDRKNSALFKAYEIPESEKKDDALNTPSVDELLKDLNSLVGLHNVKKEISSVINLQKINRLREERGIKSAVISRHLVFTGAPGTGKTTVARLLAQIYKAYGILSKGHLVETDRSDFVGGYIGHTAIKTKEIVKKSLGGILFIDEAYSLYRDDSKDFGHEAIETLLKAMEDYRDELMVIVAGYPDEMDCFLNSNPGLKSRFGRIIQFENYSIAELQEIFRGLCRKHSLILSDKASEYLAEYIHENIGENFEKTGNARDIRNLFEHVLSNQANRLSCLEKIDNDDLILIKKEDLK